MASIIDNKEKKMLDALKNSLHSADRVDILTAFFYFSGFDALADELKDKKIRILVGNTIDPECIEELCRDVRDNLDESLDEYAKRGYKKLNRYEKKMVYTDGFVELFNKSALADEFDSSESQSTFKMFMDKIKDGTLEIRLTAERDHSKAYIITNKEENNFFGDQKGVVITGSSNFTYNGLLGQGEMNERFSDNDKYDEYLGKFEEKWNDSEAIDICVKDGNTDFEKELKKRLWIYATPNPYLIYTRILYEMYSSVDREQITTPSDITNGKFYNFKYQIDAIKYGIDCIKRYNGVIIADVVGLGKSIIASSIAYNLDMRKTVIVAPPHLVEQWNDYQQEFSIRGVSVYSSGKLEEIYKKYAEDTDPILYIIDEAHRYRNELSDSYQWLHQLTRSNTENKVVLLTATPYNNRPQDLFALVKLFQTPSRSTINTVDNLGVSFRELIARYNKLEKAGKKDLTDGIKEQLSELSQQLRMLIDPVIVRRSRLDLSEIEEYRQDLEMQKIKFPDVVGPELIEYDLGEIRSLYLTTLEKLSSEFECARYKPAAYLIDPEGFNEKYGELFNEMNIQQFQGNLAQFIRRLLAMRFESSKAAFKETLLSIKTSYENIIKWWDKGYVPIKKSGILPDPDDEEIEEIFDEINNIADEPVDIEKIKKKAIPFSRDLFSDNFIIDVKNDVALLTSIYDEWFPDAQIKGFDPKYIEVRNTIEMSLDENKNRKIVIFSTYSDTATYVKDLLLKDGYRVLLYTGSASKQDREIVKQNFDASHNIKEQKNDYDIIVATDALSEGFNLNRAGVIINYDIPYNPTRVVQRIGRINRINRKMFDEIIIYNFFPTDIGESLTLIKGISRLKMLLINNIVGSDTRTLTPDEDLRSYFKKQYDEAVSDEHDSSWDNKHRNAYNAIKHNKDLLDKALSIPERSRVVRKNNEESCAISFAKRGNNMLFAYASSMDDKAKIVGPEKVMNLFVCSPDEKGYEFDDETDKKFSLIKNEIRKPYPKVNIDKRKSQAITNLEFICESFPQERDYLNDLLEVIKTYDDLSDGELKYLAGLTMGKESPKAIVEQIKARIPIHYIVQIKRKVEAIDSQTDIIMFTEDLRSVHN